MERGTVEKIGDISIEAEVYKMLRIVLQQPEENTFKDCLEALRNRLKSTAKCEQFNEYFNKEWEPKKEQWAYCFRKGLQYVCGGFSPSFQDNIPQRKNKQARG